MTEERFTTSGTTPHQPVTATDQHYDPDQNTRPDWVGDYDPGPADWQERAKAAGLEVPDGQRRYYVRDGDVYGNRPDLDPDYGGAFDGFQVFSDADPGL